MKKFMHYAAAVVLVAAIAQLIMGSVWMTRWTQEAIESYRVDNIWSDTTFADRGEQDTRSPLGIVKDAYHSQAVYSGETLGQIAIFIYFISTLAIYVTTMMVMVAIGTKFVFYVGTLKDKFNAALMAVSAILFLCVVGIPAGYLWGGTQINIIKNLGDGWFNAGYPVANGLIWATIAIITIFATRQTAGIDYDDTAVAAAEKTVKASLYRSIVDWVCDRLCITHPKWRTSC